MFEDFSFSSPSSDDRLRLDCDSTLISPLSSRCPSPQRHRFRNLPRSRSSYFRSQQQQQQQQPPPTSVPFPYETKRLSISTLTQKLHEHTLQTPHGTSVSPTHDDGHQPARYGASVLTPPDTDHDEEGYGDSSPSLSSNPSPTTMPTKYLSLDGRMDTTHDLPPTSTDHVSVRTQRQHISRLQCNQSEMEAMRQKVLSEETGAQSDGFRESDDCHPSSLPPRSSPRRRAVTLHRSRFGPEVSTGETRGGRRRSSSGALHRVDKNKSHHYSSGSGHVSKRNEQGLRRKSLVSAALASMVERESP